MPRRMSVRQAARIAKQAGYELPPHLEKYTKTLDRIESGVKAVFKCRSSTCGREYEFFVVPTVVFCECGKTTRKIWPKEN